MSRRVPRFRAPLALVLGATLTAPLALTAPAAAATGQYTVTALKFTVRAGEGSCTVDADLYRPAGVDRARASRRARGWLRDPVPRQC